LDFFGYFVLGGGREIREEGCDFLPSEFGMMMLGDFDALSCLIDPFP